MRGKVTITFSGSPTTRITPAHAGKSDILVLVMLLNKDHPRPCGEKFELKNPAFSHIGSPPPMRGKARVPAYIYLLLRITPAHAGKRPQISACRRHFEDHPRPCGEKPTRTRTKLPEMGSPPPMRGKEFQLYVHNLLDRITPAHAGKRSFRYIV